MKRAVKVLDEAGLWSYAVRLLGARAYTVAELRDKLRGRAAEAGDVDVILARCREYGYLDDARFAESYAAARRDNQGFGAFRVQQDLRKRRVSGQVAETATREAFAQVEEAEQAAAYLERKYRGKNLAEFLAEERHAAQAYRRLRTAGFGSGVAIRVLKRYTQRAEELESLEDSSSS